MADLRAARHPTHRHRVTPAVTAVTVGHPAATAGGTVLVALAVTATTLLAACEDAIVASAVTVLGAGCTPRSSRDAAVAGVAVDLLFSSASKLGLLEEGLS